MSKSGNTVVVFCKLPHGLTIELPGQPTVTLFGSNAERRGGRSANGFGITEDVDADFFQAWMAGHKDYAPVKNHLIYASAKVSDGVAESKEKKDVPTGFERLNPEKPGAGLAPDDESAQKFGMSGGKTDPTPSA